MKRIATSFLFFLLLISSTTHAQDNPILAINLPADFVVEFKQGAQYFEANLGAFQEDPEINAMEIVDGNVYRWMQFYALPSAELRAEIDASGLRLLEYVPNLTYLVSMPVNYDRALLSSWNVRSVEKIDFDLKLDKSLKEAPYGEWAVHREMIDVVVKYQKDVEGGVVERFFQEMKYRVLNRYEGSDLLTIQVPIAGLEEIAALPFVNYMEITMPPAMAEDYEGRSLHRSNTMAADYAAGRHYDGTGVSVAIGDDGEIGPHIDFTGRVNLDDVLGDETGDHGDMVAGILGGSGNLDPRMKGMAFGAFIYMMDVWNAVDNSPTMHQNDGVMITSTSYSNGCNAGYTTFAQTADQQISDNPSLIHVFSAGNAGTSDCGYGAGDLWGNVTGGVKIGKNVIATANLNDSDALETSSSRGPASDGRIKPDISANGANQMSTDPDNSYSPGGGTSAAAPGISGVLAQLFHAYRDLNGGQNPGSGLLKAVMLNTAEDLGNPGPDFKFGWGRVNGRRAVETLEQNQFQMGSIDQGGMEMHSITVPTGVSQIKIMTYWTDVEGSVTAAKALVNDIDMTVTGANGLIVSPLVLDPTPNPINLDADAVPGTDDLNNMEQVTIDNPLAGTLTVNLVGTAIPQGPQDYYVVYYYFYDDIVVTYPQGGEGFDPVNTELIRWDALGDAGSFTLEYSTDNGGTWSSIGTANGGLRQFSWNVPNAMTGQALVRISRNGVTGESQANFSIMSTPTNLNIVQACPDNLGLSWSAVPGATSYEVYILGNKFMDSIGTTSSTTFDVPITNPTVDNWVSVKAFGANGMRSERAIAILYNNGLLNCSLANDVSVTAIDSPAIATSLIYCGAFTNSVILSINNFGQNPASNFPVYYQLNNDAPVMEMFSGTLAAGAQATHQFAAPITIASSGSNTFSAWVEMTGDQAAFNDSLGLAFEAFITTGAGSTIPYMEDFEFGFVPPAGWLLINNDQGQTWEPRLVEGIAGGNTATAYVDNYSYNGGGTEDVLVSEVVDLTGATSPVLKFDVAYAYYSNTYYDGLRVDISTNCGLSFDASPYFKEKDILATAGAQTSSWQPTAAFDWRVEEIDLSAFAGNSIVIRFVNINGYGNNLYLDNINIENSTLQAPVAGFTYDPSFACEFQDLEFTSTSAGSIDTYNWDFGPDASPQTATGVGPHIVSFNSAGASNVSLSVVNAAGNDSYSEAITVLQETFADFSFTTTDDITFEFFNNSSGGNTYLWDFGDGNTSTDLNPVHTFGTANSYNVTLLTTGPCGSSFFESMVLVLSDVSTVLEGINGVQVSPNPGQGVFELSMDLADTQLLMLNVSDVSGKLLIAKELSFGSGVNHEVIDLSGMPSGVYPLTLSNGKGIWSMSLIVQ